MVSFTYKTVGAVIAIYLLAQQTECPMVAVPLITSAALTTGAAVTTFAIDVASAAINPPDLRRRQTNLRRRQTIVAPTGVPQFEFDRCYTDLSKATAINIKGPVGNRGIRIDGLPASCMNLATVIDGNAAGGPVPQPCGSACLLYDNLSVADYESMRATFEGLKKTP